MTIQITDIVPVIAFFLVFSRLLAVNFQLPIYDNLPIPMIVKILSTLVMSYCFFPYVQGEVMKDIAYVGKENFWALTAVYTIVGLVIGYLVKSIMGIFVAGGSIITQQVGFAAVQYFDPTSNQQIGPFEKLIQWTVLVMVISSGALLPMFKGVFHSFESIHIYQMGAFAKAHIFYIEAFKSIFLSAIMLATPLIFTNMLIMTILGIIARTVPQLNVIMVSFAVNIGLGLLVFAATSDEFFSVAFKIYTDKLGEWFQFVI
ncbi:MAG: hypothetical protein BM556_04470 [Bacteriovorax sp. MedPE-SWde]|nr:MAG: hypothetical protein BM556_04470 [Bacteriovorax sp. MedPE-SWde]